VIAYDARGHGGSDPAGAYSDEELAADLLGVLDGRGVERAILAGASMGAHTIVRFALDHPERVAALVVITPAFAPEGVDQEPVVARYDRLAAGLESGGVEGFVAAYGDPPVPERFKETVRTVLRQRLSRHAHPEAVAEALRQVPRSAAFGAWSDLAGIDAPAVVVASRDEADPEHPYAVGERYAAEIRGARLVSEDPGESPLAWQGSRLSRVIAGAEG